MSKKYIGIDEASKILGVSKNTLQRWDREGKLKPLKTAGNHRRYEYDKIIEYYNNPISNIDSDKRNVIGYCRVSTSGQLEDLYKQIDNVSVYCIANGYSFTIIKDLGSGLNYNKSGLIKLINLILDDKVSKIVVNYKDRLVRFGFEIIEHICLKHNVQIEVINNSDDKTFEEELVEDVLSLITVFSAKLYGSRSKKIKRLIEESKKIMNDE